MEEKYYEKFKIVLTESINKDKELIELRQQLAEARQDVLKVTEDYEKLVQCLKSMNLYTKVLETLKDVSSPGIASPIEAEQETREPEKDQAPAPIPVRRDHSKLDALGELIPYTIVFKRSHPGSLGSLRKNQRETIISAIQDFLKRKVGPDWELCFEDVRGQRQICIPQGLIDDFHSWFDKKIDEGILDQAPKQAKRDGRAVLFAFT
jgi:hypothetical protein